MILNRYVLAASVALGLAACKSAPSEGSGPNATAVQASNGTVANMPTATAVQASNGAVAKMPNEPSQISIAQPRQLHSFIEQRAGVLSFEPGGHQLFAAYGGTLTSYHEKPVELGTVSFTKNLVVGQNGVLYLDHVQWRSDADEVAVMPIPAQEVRNGYEIKESRFTPDGGYVAFQWNWRPPRGRRVDGPDGKRSYTYKRPNKPPGASTYFQLIRASDRSDVLRIDGDLRHFASSATHIAAGHASVGSRAHGTGLIELAEASFRVLHHDGENPSTPGTVAFSEDGQILAAVSSDGKLTTWAAPSFERVRTMQLKPPAPGSLAVHPHGAVFVGFEDGRMSFHDPKSGELLVEWSVPEHSELEDHQREVSAAAISSDGTRLATAHTGVGSNVRIWKIAAD